MVKLASLVGSVLLFTFEAATLGIFSTSGNSTLVGFDRLARIVLVLKRHPNRYWNVVCRAHDYRKAKKFCRRAQD